MGNSLDHRTETVSDRGPYFVIINVTFHSTRASLASIIFLFLVRKLRFEKKVRENKFVKKVLGEKSVYLSS